MKNENSGIICCLFSLVKGELVYNNINKESKKWKIENYWATTAEWELLKIIKIIIV